MTFAESFTQLGEVLSGGNRSGVRGEVGTAGAGIDPGLRLGPRCVREVRSTRRREGPGIAPSTHHIPVSWGAAICTFVFGSSISFHLLL